MREASPYCGPAPDWSDWYSAWNLDPFLIGVLLVLGLTGAYALRGRTATRRKAFTVASGAAVVAFISPLCALTVALFAARTFHHLLVFGVLAPALAVAFPLRKIGVSTSFFALSAALWLWHLPQVYSAAWDSAVIYWGMQAALILPAWAFWSVVLGRSKLDHVIWLIPLIGQMGLLGAVLTFAQRPFYLEHLAYAERFGLSALADQQLAGLIMWVPGMIPVAVLAAIMAHRILRREMGI
jgi:putative membrane protein